MSDHDQVPTPPGSVSVSESGPVAVGGDVSITGTIAAGRDVVIERLSVIADDWAPSGDAATRPGGAADVCPYPGIQPFAGDQREWFAGRDRDRRAAREHLERCDFLAVIGGSGSGKSSLLAAGIGPDFVDRRAEVGEGWTLRTLRPGAEPATLLRRLLDQPSATPTLWLVDQLEEAFGRSVTDIERTAFFDGLGDIVAGRHGAAKVVIALRSDFYPALDVHPGIADAVAADQLRLLPLDAEAMREVILRPAELVGLRVEPALVEQVLAELEPGTNQLPLLAYAMRETWRRRRNGWMTLAGYVDAGGVGEALENGAQSVWESLSPEQRETARRVFLRLTSTGDGRAATRQRVAVDALVTDRDDLDAVVDVLERFTRERLVIPDRDDQGRPTVDIAHEALLREWSVLRSWLDEDRSVRRLQRQLSDAAREWDAGGREPTGLLGGRRLQAVRTGRETGDITVNDTERAFLAAAEHRERRDRRRSVLLLVLPLILLAAAVFLAFLAQERRRSDQAKAVADALQLAAQADGLIDSRRDAGALLAVAAWRSDENPTTLGTLIDSVSDPAGPLGYPGASTGLVNALAPTFTVDGAAVIGLGDGSVRLVDPVSGAERTRFDTGLRSVSDVAVASDGTIVAGGTFGEVTVVPGGRSHPVPLHGATSEIVAVRFDPASRIVVAGVSDGTVWRWQLGAPGTQPVSLAPLEFDSTLLALETVEREGGAALVVAATGVGSLERVDLATGEFLEPLGDVDTALGVSLVPGPRGLLVRSSNRILVWDVAAGVLVGRSDEFFFHLSSLAVAATRPAYGDSVVVAFTGSSSGELQEWTLDPRPIPVSRARQALGDAVAAVATDGSTVLALDGSGRLTAWDVASRRSPAAVPIATRPSGEQAVAISPEGAVASGGAGTGPVVVTTTGGTSVSIPALSGNVTGLAWRSATTLVAGTDDGAVREYDLSTGTTTVLASAGGAAIVDVVVSGDGRTLAFATGQGAVTVVATAESTRTLLVPGAPGVAVVSLAIAPDGGAVAVGTDAASSSSAVVWDLDGGADDPVVLSGHTLKVSSIAFSPVGDVLATGSDDRSIRLWSLPSGDEIATLDGHTDMVEALVFSPDGRQLVSGGEDFTIRVWDVEDRVPLGTPWRWADATVSEIALAPDGRSLVAANGPAVVRWVFSVDGWTSTACNLAGRNLTDDEWRRLAPNHEPIAACTIARPTSPTGGLR